MQIWDKPAERLRQALDDDELQLYAQKIVHLTEPQENVFAEALVRLREEEERLLPPGAFLPVFERHGMMPQLDRWVVRHAIARLVQSSGPGSVSINLSAQTLVDQEFPDYVAEHISNSGISSTSLLFEISESDVLARPTLATRFVVALRRVECGLILDSFGENDLSSHVPNLVRPRYLKIDRSIVRNVETNSTTRRKLEAIVRAGKAIGAQLIGECVETAAIEEILRKAGVELGQGYGIHEPVPIERVFA